LLGVRDQATFTTEGTREQESFMTRPLFYWLLVLSAIEVANLTSLPQTRHLMGLGSFSAQTPMKLTAL
jgi:hypothetical protein